MNAELERAERTTDSDGALLEARNITKVFTRGSQFIALQDASISLGRGEFVSILGPSGCGKTTLLRICAGLMTSTAGEVHYQATLGCPSPGSYGMVFQQPGLFQWRTVAANVALPGEVLGLDRAKTRSRIDALLRLVNLAEARDKYPHELSGGMQQRASIARALVHNPELLLMDEPFGALDALTRDRMNVELQSLHMQAKKSVLFVTHGIREAVFLSDRVYVMTSNPGRVIDEVQIPFPRPRSSSIQAQPEFVEIEQRIRTGLGTEVPA